MGAVDWTEVILALISMVGSVFGGYQAGKWIRKRRARRRAKRAAAAASTTTERI